MPSRYPIEVRISYSYEFNHRQSFFFVLCLLHPPYIEVKFFSRNSAEPQGLGIITKFVSKRTPVDSSQRISCPLRGEKWPNNSQVSLITSSEAESPPPIVSLGEPSALSLLTLLHPRLL